MGNTVLFLCALWLLAACASTAPAQLSAPQHSVQIAGLGPCSDSPERALRLAPDTPVTVLVHGCFSSAGSLGGLGDALARRGQQSVCFSYNDRDSLNASAQALKRALGQVHRLVPGQPLTVIGHSQGALIARKAMVADSAIAVPPSAAPLRLVTLSGPFAGIAAANACGNVALRRLSLGIVGAVCQAVTGDKWREITSNSPFIAAPGRLGPQVERHLKVVTDERGTCRRSELGRCAESDKVFSLAEQRNPVVDSDPAVQLIEVKAGHVAIVGDEHVAPAVLIHILQAYGFIGPG